MKLVEMGGNHGLRCGCAKDDGRTLWMCREEDGMQCIFVSDGGKEEVFRE